MMGTSYAGCHAIDYRERYALDTRGVGGKVDIP